MSAVPDYTWPTGRWSLDPAQCWDWPPEGTLSTCWVSRHWDTAATGASGLKCGVNCLFQLCSAGLVSTAENLWWRLFLIAWGLCSDAGVLWDYCKCEYRGGSVDTRVVLVFLITVCIEKNKLSWHRMWEKLLLRVGRRQRVVLSNYLSDWKNELWKMVLEVVLFSAFICDLEKVMNSEVSSFVGDTTSFK